MDNKNSKKITIYRAGSFLSRAQGKEIEDYFSNSKRSIGSYFESVDSKRVASGLTFAEEKILLPLFIEVEKDDREFTKRRNDFYIDLDTQIPHNTGRTLEIGLTDNSKPLSEDNLPIEPMDYIRYRHTLKHVQVALSKELADGNPLKEFYIFDKQTLQEKTSKKTKEKDDALRIYLEIKEDSMKTKMMLTLLGVDPRAYATEKNEKELLVEELKKLAETKPDVFVSTFNSSDLETEYWIKSLLNAGIFKMIGKKYIDVESNKLIGNDLEETVMEFNDEKNSDLVVTWKARYQDKQYSKK